MEAHGDRLIAGGTVEQAQELLLGVGEGSVGHVVDQRTGPSLASASRSFVDFFAPFCSRAGPTPPAGPRRPNYPHHRQLFTSA
jgi:hypothetical protein